MRKKIIFAMIEAGGGHKMPAKAVSESIEELFPGKYEIRIMDFMKELGCTAQDAKHKALWQYLLSHPKLTKGIQTFDFITGPLNIQIYKMYFAPFYKKALKYLREERPDLVFSSHYFNTMALSYARKRNEVNPILVNYLTEIFDFDSYWNLRDVDYYLVTSKQAQKKLLRKNFPKDKLFVFPYPIRNSFFRLKRTEETIRRSLGIDESKKTLLVALGGEGIGSLHKILPALCILPLNVIVVTGNNQALKLEIEQKHRDKRQNANIIPLGFVNNFNELISISDICYIKPGPATTWEVMSYKKPIIFNKSAQLCENSNIKYVCENELGLYAGSNPKKLKSIINNLLNGSALEKYKASYDRVNIQNGSDRIAKFIDAVLEKDS